MLEDWVQNLQETDNLGRMNLHRPSILNCMNDSRRDDSEFFAVDNNSIYYVK